MSCIRDCILRSSQDSSPGMTTTKVLLLWPAMYGDACGGVGWTDEAWAEPLKEVVNRQEDRSPYLAEEVHHLRLVRHLHGAVLAVIGHGVLLRHDQDSSCSSLPPPHPGGARGPQRKGQARRAACRPGVCRTHACGQRHSGQRSHDLFHISSSQAFFTPLPRADL